jgi:hypothetical protein
VERAVMELRVTDESGKAVFATRAEADLQDGGALVVYDVPRLALLGGDYDLAVGADDAARGDAPSPERVSRFSVAAEPGAEGVADLRGTWSVGAGASAGVPR